MADGSEDSFVVEDIAYEGNEFEEGVQSAIATDSATEKVSHDRVPSARSSARSIHDSYRPADSPIPGDRQIFSRPYEHDINTFASQGMGLPPLPQVPNGPTSFSVTQSAMSNPLFAGESVESLQDDEQDNNTGYGHGQAYLQSSEPVQQDSEAMPPYYTANHFSPSPAAYPQQPEHDSMAASYSPEDSLPDMTYVAHAANVTPQSAESALFAASDQSAAPQHEFQIRSGHPAVQDTQPLSRQSTGSPQSIHHARRSSSLGSVNQQYPSHESMQLFQHNAEVYTSEGDISMQEQVPLSYLLDRSATPTPTHAPMQQSLGHESSVSPPEYAAQPIAGSNSSRDSSRSQSLQRDVMSQNAQSNAAHQNQQWQRQLSSHAASHASEEEYLKASVQRVRPESGSSQHSHQQGYVLQQQGYLARPQSGRSKEPQQGYSAQPRPRSAQRQTRQPSRGPSRPRSPLPGAHSGDDLTPRRIAAYQPPSPRLSSPHSPQERPGSAVASKARLEAAVQQSMQQDVRCWAPAEVCDWCDFIGLGQYRKKFVHHCIDGSLLLRLSDRDLKEELGIAPLGHRQGLLMAIADLADYNSQLHDSTASQEEVHWGQGRPQSAPGLRGGSPARPRSAAPGSPGSPERGLKQVKALKALELREHLVHEMHKAQARAAHRQARAGDAAHHAEIAGEETKKLRGQIFDLERKAGLKPLIRPSSGVQPRMGPSLDVLGHIPWHPAGKGPSTTPLCKAGPDMEMAAPFHPHMNQHSLEIMQERRGSSHSASFLNRLEADIHGRKMRLQSKAERLHSQMFGDANMAQAKADHDAHFLRQYVQTKTGQDLTKENMGEGLEEILGSYKTELGVTDKEAEALEHLQGNAKAQKLVAMVRRHHFMERYQAEISARDDRIKESKKLGREVPKKTRMTTPEVKVNSDEADVKKCAAHFESCGWDPLDFDPSSGGPDGKFDAVLKRVHAQQEVQEKVNAALQASKAATVSMIIPTAQVDWSRFRSDGLEALQEGHMASKKKGGGKEGPGGGEGGAAPKHILHWTVHLLANCTKDDIEQLEKLHGVQRCVAFYRAINSQRFIEFTREDLQRREEKHEKALKALEPQRKLLSKEDADKFFDRLINDAEKRKQSRADMIRKAREAEDKRINELRSQMQSSRKPRHGAKAH